MAGIAWIPIAGWLHAQETTDPATSKAAQLLDLWAEALGGRDRLSQIENIYTMGSYEGTSGSGTVEEWRTAQGERRQLNVVGGRRELNVFDGSQGWVSHDGRTRPLSPEEVRGALVPAYLGSYSHLLPGRLRGRIEYKGQDPETKAHILQLRPDGGHPCLVHLDRETHLPVKKSN
jgi:hypothetical protein